jgi:hypothetical protein
MLKKIIHIDYRHGFKIALQYSFAITGLFVIVFLIARIFDFAKFTELRFINYFLAFFVSFEALRKLYNDSGHYVDYFNGLVVGILTVTLGQLWYAILFYIYLIFDHDFLNYLLTVEVPQNVVAPHFSIAVLLFTEGFGLSPIISLALMQYFKYKQGRWAHNENST